MRTLPYHRRAMEIEGRPVFIRLFGVPTLEIDGVRTVLAAERPHLLLAYLACCRDWVRRDELAELFWPQHPPGDEPGDTEPDERGDHQPDRRPHRLVERVALVREPHADLEFPKRIVLPR